VPYKLQDDSRGRFSTSDPPMALRRDLSRREKFKKLKIEHTAVQKILQPQKHYF
jgi:hypothetical protein